VCLRLRTPFLGSSTTFFLKFLELREKWKQQQPLGDIHVRWVPGHSNVEGNELADRLAKEAAGLPLQNQVIKSFASLKRLSTSFAARKAQLWWNKNATKSYRELSISTFPLPPKELSLPREALGRLIAARTGHGDFSTYHTRFAHIEAELLCSCSKDKTPIHFFFCQRAKRRYKGTLGPPSIIPDLLGTEEGVKTFVKFLKDTNFYKDICPYKA